MTQPRRPPAQTPQEAINAGQPPSISVISQRRITIQPVPGQTQDQVVVTYRIAPHPPQVLFIDLAQLPAWVWRRDHPGQEPPEALERQNDDALRTIIQAQRRPPSPIQRMI